MSWYLGERRIDKSEQSQSFMLISSKFVRRCVSTKGDGERNVHEQNRYPQYKPASQRNNNYNISPNKLANFPSTPTLTPTPTLKPRTQAQKPRRKANSKALKPQNPKDFNIAFLQSGEASSSKPCSMQASFSPPSLDEHLSLYVVLSTLKLPLQMAFMRKSSIAPRGSRCWAVGGMVSVSRWGWWMVGEFTWRSGGVAVGFSPFRAGSAAVEAAAVRWDLSC